MRDWESLVGGRMGGLKLCAETRHDVVRELASHFEDIYDEARERGASDEQAGEHALNSVHDWSRLARDVQKEKENVMTTTPFRRCVVFPGMLALVLSAMAMWTTSMLFRSGAQYVFHVIGDPRTYFAFNLPWLIALPIAGAAGAWMSWWYGGTSRQRLLAAIFPHVAMLAALLVSMFVLSPLAFVIAKLLGAPGPHLTQDDFSIIVWMVRLYRLFTPWVIVPAISSAIGALPFLWLKPHAAEGRPTNEAHA